MSVFLSPVGGAGAQFFDNNGNPLTGGKLYTYAAGTTTPQATYTSAAGSTFHTNPIVLDAAGRVPGSSEIWLADSQIYKFVLKDSNDVLLAMWDQITGVNSNFINYIAETEVQTATAGQTVFTLTTMTYSPGTGNLTVFVDGVNQYEGTSYLETDGTTVTFTAGLHVGALVKFTTAVQTTGNATDASVVTYDPPFTGSVAYTVQDKLAQTVSVKDFGAVGDGVADDTVAIQTAIASQAGTLIFPSGSYKTTAKLTTNNRGVGPNQRLVGDTTFGSVSITAFHSDDIFEYKRTVSLYGLNFYRAPNYRATAITNQKSGIIGTDTIGGAAYSSFRDTLVYDGSYFGIKIVGTHQYFENCTADGCKIGIQVNGANHSLIHCATERNAICAVEITGSTNRVRDHYADDNCADLAAGYGVITVNGSYNDIDASHFNNNNGAQHYYVTNKYNTFGSAGTYGVAEEFPRATSTSFRNYFRSPVVFTPSGANAYQNYLGNGSTYPNGTTNPLFNNIIDFSVMEGYASSLTGNSTYVLAGGQPILANNGGVGYVVMPPNFSLLKNSIMEIYGVSCWAKANPETSTVVSYRVRVWDRQNNTTWATLLTVSNVDIQYGNLSTAEDPSSISTRLTYIPCGSSASRFVIYVENTTATEIDNFYYRIIYGYKSSGTYA